MLEGSLGFEPRLVMSDVPVYLKTTYKASIGTVLLILTLALSSPLHVQAALSQNAAPPFLVQ